MKGQRNFLRTTKFRAAVILVVGILGALLLIGFGCSRTNTELSQASSPGEGLSWLNMRPSSGDTARVLRNAHYLKLMGRPDLALKELEAAYQYNPRNLKVLDTLARTYEEVGEFTSAQKIYQEALALDGSNQALHNNLCFSYYLAGQWEKAESGFREALARNPQNIMARNNLGLLLCRLGRSEEARRLWQEAEGNLAAQKKMQQVIVALSSGKSAPAAQQPAPPPVQVASAPPKDTMSARPELAKETSAIAATLPASAPASAAPALPAREPEKPAVKPAPVAAQPEKLPAAQVSAKPAAPLPAVPAPKAQEAEKPAPKPVMAEPQPGKSPEIKVTAGKPASPQSPEPSVAAKAKTAPAAPPAAAKPLPDVAKEKPAPAARAEAKPQPQATPPAPPKQNQEAEKKVTPATTPPPPRPGKIQVAAAASPMPAALEKSEKVEKHGIEVLNGSGVKKLAHQTRSLLKSEGYRVVSIGNYRDFGAENTTIYYRPGAETAARNLSAKLFPQSQVQPGDKFAKNADITILLGKDQAAPVAAARAVPAADKVAAKTGDAGQPEPVTAKPAPPAAPAAQATAPAPQPPPAPKATAAATPNKANRPYLTAAELEATAIDIRNGTRAKNLAHMARAMISREGFQVTHIGNHIDFGAEKTIIYYLPEAEKVARKLGSQFFPDSQLQQAAKLPGNASIKILLGSDLLQRPEVMAKLSD